MIGLRTWILLAVGVAFLAGLAAGILSQRMGPRAADSGGPLGLYREALVREFDLPPERERALFSVLDVYGRRLEDLRAEALATREEDLVSLVENFQGLIRNYVLPTDQRERFDALCAGGQVPVQG